MTASHDMLAGMYEHSRWSNRRLLDQAAQLTDAELDAPVNGGYGSLRVTLAHMMIAQNSWFRRFQELDPVAPADPADFPDVASLRAVWEVLDEETIQYVAQLSDDDLLQIIHIRSWSGWQLRAPRWEALLHQAFHQQQHRGEIAMVLTQLGHSPGDLDPMDYFEETGSAVEVG